MSTANHRGCNRTRVYLAAPLFSEAEQTFNLRVTELLEEFTQVYLPQRDGGLMSEMVAGGVPSGIAARRVFRRDIDAIRQVDCVITILDGRTIDEGVAFELGVAFSETKRCVGLQTDSRRLAMWGNNPMITGALETVFMSIDDLMEWVKTSVLENGATSWKDWKLTTACT
ncbi:nucleoside 2-deoxyribosyltransferase [bacterium BMS3Abin12]|nr:nucleoside 2-deoxyribosyltransferase [bacterium BMS3Abin12]